MPAGSDGTTCIFCNPDLVGRLFDMQVEEGIPLYVIPVQPIARIVADFRAQNPDWNRLLPSFG